jgi:quercetin dioxygenase-like cupin family protein
MSREQILQLCKSSNHRKNILVGLAVATLVSGALLWATPAVGDIITVLQRSTTADRIKIQIQPHDQSDILIQEIRILPGGNTGWHSHPGPGVVAVKSGVVALYSGDDRTCTPTYVTAGNGFFEEANHVHFVRNIGAVTYEAYGTFVLPAGAPGRIDAPSSGNCPF